MTNGKKTEDEANKNTKKQIQLGQTTIENNMILRQPKSNN